MPQPIDGVQLTDAARLNRSFVQITQILDRAVSGATAFCSHQVGFTPSNTGNPYLYVRDANATDCIVCCYACQTLWQASYTIAADDTVAFGTATRKVEAYVDAPGEAITDSIAHEDDTVEILDSAGGLPRIRLLSTKANTVINGRAYSGSALRSAVAELKQRIASGLVYSEVPHPEPIRNAEGKVTGYKENRGKRVSRLTDVTLNDRGEVHVTHEFLDTPLGRSVAESFTKRTGNYGTSSRSIGRDKTTIAGRNVPLYNTVKIFSFDFVDNPAFKDTLKSFDVLLDSELPAPPSPPEAPPAQAASAPTPATGQAPKETPVETNTTNPTGGVPATTTPAIAGTVPVAQPATITLTADQFADLTEASRIIKANTEREAAEAARAEVTTYLQSADVTQSMSGFPEEFRAPMLKRAGTAKTRAEAEQILTSEVEATSRAIALATLAAQGFKPTGQGATTSTQDGPRVDLQVTDHPKPYLQVVKNFQHAYDVHALRASNFIPDPALRSLNQRFVDEIASAMMNRNGAGMIESGTALLDSKDGWEVLADSATSTSNLWNQPSFILALITLAYQDLVFMKYCGGYGPDATEWERQTINGQVGTVFKVPTEIWLPPNGSIDLPGYDNSLFSAEDAGVPVGNLQTSWQTFFPSWSKIAVEVTKEVQSAMKNGPLAYDVMVRLVYNMVQEMARRKDNRIAAEMIQIADEYAAQAITGETVASGNLVQNTSTNKLYGANVTYYANIIGAGSSGTPGRDPIVRRRKVGSMNGQGQFSTSTLYAVTCTGASTTQVEGYLDPSGQIQSLPGTTATFAVDFNNGRFCFNAASNVDGTHLPTLGYTFVTNYTPFSLTVPNGVEPAYYYNRLLTCVDQTAAVMGSFPRFMEPNLCLGSKVAMTYIENAQIFYKLAQPEGTRLMAATRNSVAERGGIAYEKHNNPWAVGDSRFLLTRLGSTKVAVDTPLEVEGPFSTQDVTNGSPGFGLVKSNKTMMATENVAVCTAQAVDQSGNIRNPVARSIVFR